MLIEDTLFDHIDKVKLAIERIQAFEPEEGYYVAFSGGKDSIVVLDLVRKSGVKHDAHMNMTSVDPPELVRFVKKNYPDVIRHKPVMSMWKLIELKQMPPTRIARYCCQVLKEGSGTDRFVVLGVRWAESAKRAKRKMVESCTTGRTRRFLSPIIDWSNKDVWQYIKENNLVYPSLYDEGFKRIGCIGCPMTNRKNRIEHFKRWPIFETMYRRTFDRLVQLRKIQNNPFIKWADGDAMFRWWMEEDRKTDKDQLVIFE
jgi:phosphoadenosine phosphosulfate reductase